MEKATKHILVVDDNKMNLTILKRELSEYQVTPVVSGAAALKFLEKKLPDLILLDVNMPEMDGKETLRRIRERENGKEVPVIFITADNTSETEVECLALGADDYISKPFIPEVMRRRISRSLELWELRNNLEDQLTERTIQVKQVTLQSITAIAYAIDAKDSYTRGHSVRVARCSIEIAKRMGWESDDLQSLFFTALMHDIGKIGVPDSILNKPSSLTNDEYEVMKKHPLVGGEILKDMKIVDHMEEGARYHHERYDGRGYPYGLKGEEIPIVARIIGVADAYDAMTSNRIYRKKLSEETVKDQIRQGRGTQFDPDIAELFLNMLEEGFVLPNTGAELAIGLDGDSAAVLDRLLNQYTSYMIGNEDKDILTGLYNRNYAQRMIEKHLEEGDETGCAVILLDADNLQYINDNFGHLAGDLVIKEISVLLSRLEVGDGFVARTGGDEFLVFLIGSRERESLEERARELLNMLQHHFNSSPYSEYLSFSMGIAISEEDEESLEGLCSNADKALHYAKRLGRISYQFYGTGEDGKVYDDFSLDESLLKYIVSTGSVGSPKGVLRVNTSEFNSICEFLRRSVDRKQQLVQMVLLTLTDKGCQKGHLDWTRLKNAMEVLERVVSESIRSMDVATKYSGSQLLVVLVDTDQERARMVVDRVINHYEEAMTDETVKLTYNIQEMKPMEKPVNYSEKRQ